MTEATLRAVVGQVADRLAQHRANLAGWSEGRYCPTCQGTGRLLFRHESRLCLACNGAKVLDVGSLVPIEPDPEERERVRRELRAAIAELEMIGALLK